MSRALALLGLLALGCAQGAPVEGVEANPVTDTEKALPEAPVEACTFSFNASGDVASNSVARWSAAMGCDIQLATDGVPVTIWPGELWAEYASDGTATLFEHDAWPGRTRLCGLSTWDDERTAVVRIDVASNNTTCTPEESLMHEMGHALIGRQGHTATGIMADGHNPNHNTMIDSASLEAVCSSLPCTQFQPEI